MELNNNPVKIKTAEEINNTSPKAEIETGTETGTEAETETEAGIETKVKVSESITYRDVNYII